MILTLLTDFGDTDPYVASMRGVILRINPGVKLIDITHNLEPHQIKGAAWVLNCFWRFYPPGTVHLAVVDPGVGGKRRAIIVTKGDHTFVGPDNGIFSYLYEESFSVYEITNPKYILEEVSDTFHGRDIFAPVAAHISKGVDVQEIGKQVANQVFFQIPQPKITPEGIQGTVIYIDHFGNLITNIRRELFESVVTDHPFEIVVNDMRIRRISKSYDESPRGSPLAIWGSETHLEISANLSSAAKQLGIGDLECDETKVVIRKEGK